MNKRVFLTCILMIFSAIVIVSLIVLIFGKKYNEEEKANNSETEQSSQNYISDNNKPNLKNDNTIIVNSICENAYSIKEVISKIVKESMEKETNNQEIEDETNVMHDSNEQPASKNKDNNVSKDTDVKSNESTNNGQAQGEKANSNSNTEVQNRENVSPGWLYYCSKGGNGLSGEQKAYLDSVISQWTGGAISSSDVENKFAEKIAGEWNLQMSVAGVSGNQVCLYKSRAQIPNYNTIVSSRSGTYNFIGLYTKGEYDDCGNLICYYWEAGVM